MNRAGSLTDYEAKVLYDHLERDRKLKALVSELEAVVERLKKEQDELQTHCPHCGPDIALDEDLCCADCGAPATLDDLVDSYKGLEIDVERLEAESKRLRAMFETAASLLGETVEMYGLAGDEATEEIAQWVALAEKEEEKSE